MRALLIICLFPFVEFCMGKGRTFCGDGQRLAATFAPLAASRACGCREKGRGEGLPAAPHSVGKRRAVRWAMQRAAMADAACCAGLYSVLHLWVRKIPFSDRICLLPCFSTPDGHSHRWGKVAEGGLQVKVIILPETLLRSSFFPAKVKKTCPIVLCYARLALPLQK